MLLLMISTAHHIALRCVVVNFYCGRLTLVCVVGGIGVLAEVGNGCFVGVGVPCW